MSFYGNAEFKRVERPVNNCDNGERCQESKSCLGLHWNVARSLANRSLSSRGMRTRDTSRNQGSSKGCRKGIDMNTGWGQELHQRTRHREIPSPRDQTTRNRHTIWSAQRRASDPVCRRANGRRGHDPCPADRRRDPGRLAHHPVRHAAHLPYLERRRVRQRRNRLSSALALGLALSVSLRVLISAFRSLCDHLVNR